MAEWGLLAHHSVAHGVERYGLEEVQAWFFKVWNEPNRPGVSTGSRQEYWQLDAEAARAVKSQSNLADPSR